MVAHPRAYLWSSYLANAQGDTGERFRGAFASYAMIAATALQQRSLAGRRVAGCGGAESETRRAMPMGYSMSNPAAPL